MEEARDVEFMLEALKEARKAFNKGEIPVGAVIVKEGKIVGRGHNMVENLNDATAHAEIIAIRDAYKTLSNWRLQETTLYVTLEPCVMCSGAIVLSRIREVVYALEDEKFGGAATLFKIPEDPRLNHRARVRRGPLGEEALGLLRAFFKRGREEKAERG